ncbi:MAG: ABC transporter permease [Bacillota bacterium]|nr:ABC transporter permease [Bacillota bacterium]
MILLSAVKMAWESIISNKLRSFLTMLGIIIGVCAVIILVSLVQGATSKVTESFDSLGTTQVIATAKRSYQTRTFDYDDVEDLMWDNCDLITGFIPKNSTSATLRVGGSNGTTPVTGTNEYYDLSTDKTTQLGRLINSVDVENASKVIVIGEYNALTYFGSVQASIGKTIKVNGLPFTVVGVMEKQTDTIAQYSSDDMALVPYTTAVNNLGTGALTGFTLIAKDVNSIDSVMSITKKFMYDIYGDSDRYTVVNMQEMLDKLNEMTTMLSGVLAGIAGISLLVAGIGIMNIMLVSVTERTKEIGIRKAIGAKRSSILLQFLVEATSVSLFGGIMGIVLGVIVAVIAGKIIGIAAKPTLWVIVVSLVYSMAVGLFFGLNPARKASKLSPIEALRSE